MKKLSLLVVSLAFVVCLAGCWKKKTEEVKPVEAAPVTQMPVEPVRESSPVAPATTEQAPVAPAAPAATVPVK